MLDTILLAIAVIVTFAGCAILFVDVVATKKTDFCQEETPARYVGKGSDDQTESNRRSGLFVLAVPEFRYEFEGRTYQGKSANVFFHLYLGRKQLPVPFLDGKTYLIYVNPAQPAMTPRRFCLIKSSVIFFICNSLDASKIPISLSPPLS